MKKIGLGLAALLLAICVMVPFTASAASASASLSGPGTVRAVELEPGVIYNVRRGAWHTHATGPDASVLIVENADVSPENSDHIPVNVGWLFRREEEK